MGMVLSVEAAELVMFERSNCPYCLAWKQEVGEIYPLTEEGRVAPLRIVRLGGDSYGIVLRDEVKYSPTFVLVHDGEEIGRIVGYTNDDAFWGLLKDLVAKLDSSLRMRAQPAPDQQRLR